MLCFLVRCYFDDDVNHSCCRLAGLYTAVVGVHVDGALALKELVGNILKGL